jgi:glycosyltransferase involved in cell wall biosynthesis
MKTLFLYYDPHPAHARLARQVNAKFFPSPRLKSSKKGIFNFILDSIKISIAVLTLPRNFDVYLCEGTYIIPALAKKMGLIKNAKIINILASPLLYYLKIGDISGVKRFFAIQMLREVDEFICMGKMEEELLKELLPNAKTIVKYPLPNPDLVKTLLKTSNLVPKLDSHKLLFIGKQDAYYKGVDLLLDSFKTIKKIWPDAELTIIGKITGIEKDPKKMAGVKLLGYVDDIVKPIKEHSLYIHLGRGDAFPVSVIEAMLGGLPALVSEWTGSKEIICNVDKHLIVPLNKSAITNGISWYFELNHREKITLSNKLFLNAKTLYTNSKNSKFNILSN